MTSLLRMLRRDPARVRRPAARPAVEALEGRALPSVLCPLSQTLARLDDPAAVPGYTPAQIRHAYGLDGMNFGSANVAATGQGQTLAIVTAYDDPNLVSDLATFDTYFKLSPVPTLTRIAQDGTDHLPAADAGWAQETALDVEWAHVIAPQTNLLVVEANSADEADLFAAADTAAAYPNVSVVSMSFGGPEQPSETAADSHFQPGPGRPAVTFVAAAGDSGTVTYPAASPYVIGVGGTTLTLDAQGNRVRETAWAKGGGGLSAYEATPAFQQNVPPANLAHRGTPDVAYDADPNTGFAVYDSYGSPDSPWASVGGTSAGAPQWAALLAIANQGRGTAGLPPVGGAAQTLPQLYALQSSAFYDVTSGGNGHYQAGPGYDLVTGLGTPNAQQLVTALMHTPPPGGPGPSQPPGNGGDPPGQPPADPPASPPIPSLTVTGGHVTAVAGSPLTSVLATVTDATGSLTADALTATIAWGDGRSSVGTIVALGGGRFEVTGVVDYGRAGSYPIAVTVTAHESLGDETAGAVTLATIVPDPPPPSDPAPDDPSGVPLSDPFVPEDRQALAVRRPHHAHHVHARAHPKPHHPRRHAPARRRA